MRIISLLLAALTLCASPLAAAEPDVPSVPAESLPDGFAAFRAASVETAAPARRFLIVAALREDDPLRSPGSKAAPVRPLLIFEETSEGAFEPMGRNDFAVYRADEGGQCDPFEDGRITAEGAVFTVENAVACGEHWEIRIAFRFDPAENAFLFAGESYEEWYFNPDDSPDAQALISSGARVETPPEGEILRFSDWGRP